MHLWFKDSLLLGNQMIRSKQTSPNYSLCFVNLEISMHSIIESVDSICRDRADMQCMIISKYLSKCQKQYKLISLYGNIPFIFHDQHNS